MQLRPAALLRPEYVIPVAAYAYFLWRYQSAAYAAIGAALLIAAAVAARKPVVDGWSARLPTLLLAALAVLLPALGLLQFLRIADPGDVDHSCYACALWNLRHGETHYSVAGMDIFGTHANYTLVLWIPLHDAFGEAGLKLGKAACLLAAVLLARRGMRGAGMDRESASLAAAGLLLAPPIASQFFFGFHPEFLGAPVLVIALLAYRDGRLGRFLACTAFLAYSKEVYTLAVGGILLVALAERRPWRWVLLPGLLCTVQMAVYWFVVVPRFAPAGNHMEGHLPGLSALPQALMRGENLVYALHVLLPFLPALARYPRRYLLLPLPLLAFYSIFPDPSFRDVFRHYAFPIALLAAAPLLLHRVPGSRGDEGGEAGDGDGAGAGAARAGGSFRLALAVLTAATLCYPLWRPPLDFLAEGGHRARLLARASAQVPDEAPVLVHGSFVARFAARRIVGNWVYRNRPHEAYDYILLDAGYTPPWISADSLRRDLERLRSSPDWEVLLAEDGLYLFRKAEGRAP